MSLRRSGFLALALASLAGGCAKEISQGTPAPTIVFASFASPNIPTPNDLALQATPTLPQSAQRDLLQSFVDKGGFPADQAPTLSIPLRTVVLNGDVYTSEGAPTPILAVSSITADTVALFKIDVAPPVRIAIEPAAAQAPGSLSLVPGVNASGNRRLAPGRYVFAIRGGSHGVKTTEGIPVSADQPIALTIPNKDLSNPEHQPVGGLSAPQVAQLETIRALLWQNVGWLTANLGAGNVWVPCIGAAAAALGEVCAAKNAEVKSSAYGAIDAAFSHTEIASIAAFSIAPAESVPLVDATSGQAPLPIDLLRTGPGGTIAQNPAFGPAASGLATLDGFSTTAMILAPTSFPVNASTVHGGNVLLYKLGATPAVVPELKAALGSGGAIPPASARYVAQPGAIVVAQGPGCPIAGGCSPAIGLQPAVPAQTPAGAFFLPPLDEDTSYAVVITKRVTDVAGQPLGRPTFMTLLLDPNPLVHPVSGASLVSGVNTATATAIQAMRAELQPVFAALPAGTTLDGVALAYTFKTQSFKATSLKLAAAPYSIEAGAGQAIFTPSAATAVTAPPSIPTTGVAAFYDVTFKSVDAIDKATGALRPTLSTDLGDPATVAGLLSDLHALVAVPSAAAAPACPSPPFPAGARCAPLVVFGHGLDSSKESMFAVASSLAQAGFVAAAIDFPLHGSRNWCSQNSDCEVPSTGAVGTCTPFEGGAGQGDAATPGVCSGGSVPVTAGSRYFVGANFFRTRDAFRQNLLDVGALALALNRPPTLPAPPANPFTALLPAGLLVDPSNVYYEAMSLGSIAGTSVLAANSRVSRGALSVGGGTMADLFTQSPSFQPRVAVLFTTLLADELQGRQFTFDMIDPASPEFDMVVAQGFLQTLNVAKWILDPGEAVNYAANLIDDPLPNLLANPNGSVLQASKDVYGQIAQGDLVIPNAFNSLLYSLIGADQTLYTGPGATHSMLATQPLVQADAAGFLANPSSPPPAARALP